MTTKTRSQAGRILVVDDSQVVRHVVADLLRKAGHSVDEAANGNSAVSQLETAEYDVVITDLRMPERDGFGVLEAVRNASLSTEVIILTGTHANDVECAVRALRLGAHDYLPKPPQNAEQVILTVDRALEKKRLREANLRLLRQLEELSLTDPLTGALNRRAFDNALRREVSRARRYGLVLSLVLVDLDHFKRINDTFGHPAGDEILKAFVKRLEQGLRESDALHRYGGEEFAILLPHTGEQGARELGERLLASIAREPFLVARRDLRLTASAGLAWLSGPALDHLSLVEMADRALYLAKQRGRNRLESAEVVPPTTSN
jgi:two-component system, cell cycle response regulator